MTSVFTQMMAGELPSWKVAEDENHIAFLEMNPSAYGHVVCLPKKEIASLFDMSDETYTSLMLFCKQIAKKLKEVVPCKKIGMSVIGLKTLHTHVHLVPLNEMDDILFKNNIPTNEDYFKHLQKKLEAV